MTGGARIAVDARHIGRYGIGRYIRDLLVALGRLEGNETYIVITNPVRKHLLPKNDRFVIVEDSSALYSVQGLSSVGRHARDHRADLVHATHYVVPFTRRPVLVTIHDLIHLRIPNRQFSWTKRVYARLMIRRAIHKARRIITPTDAIRKEIVETYKTNPSKIDAIHHGIDPNHFFVEPEKARPREPFFLFVGNDLPHKNVDRLIESFSNARDRIEPIQLVLVGKTFQRFANLPGVRVEGVVSDEALADFYRRTSAIILPSTIEGFGFPVLEAMACGAPVMASNIPALREVAGDCALYFDPSSIESIESSLVQIARDDALRSRLGTAGPLRAAEFRWETAAAKTLAAYRLALD